MSQADALTGTSGLDQGRDGGCPHRRGTSSGGLPSDHATFQSPLTRSPDVSPESLDELRDVAAPVHRPGPPLGDLQARGGPPQHHPPVPPALHVAGHGPGQRPGYSQPADGEGLLHPLGQRRGRSQPPLLQPGLGGLQVSWDRASAGSFSPQAWRIGRRTKGRTSWGRFYGARDNPPRRVRSREVWNSPAEVGPRAGPTIGSRYAGHARWGPGLRATARIESPSSEKCRRPISARSSTPRMGLPPTPTSGGRAVLHGLRPGRVGHFRSAASASGSNRWRHAGKPRGSVKP